MAQVGALRLRHRVVIDVDDVIQHAHSRAHGLAQLVEIEAIFTHVLGQVDGTEVADGDFVLAGVEGDLGTQVG